MRTKYFELTLLALLIAIGLLALYTYNAIQDDQNSDTASANQEIMLDIKNRVSGNQDYIQLLVQMRARGELNLSNFETRVLPYLDTHPELINITWVDEKSYIRGVVPMEGNQQIIGLHLDLPEPARVSQLAKRTNSAQYTDSFEAIQGDCSFEVWLPVFKQENFLGFIAGVYSCQGILEATAAAANHPLYAIYIANDQGAKLAGPMQINRKLTGITASQAFPTDNNLKVTLQRYTTTWDSEILALIAIILVLSIVVAFNIQRINHNSKRRIALQNDLENVNEELKQFAYRTSHDLNAPLITIASLAKFIQKDIASGNQQEALENCDKIIQSSSKLQNLIVSILKLTKADATKEPGEEIDFASIVNGIKHTWQTLSYENSVEIRTNIQLNQPFVAEPARITQILENLISNSIKYCNPEQDRCFVNIKVVNSDHMLCISVEDNGLGIPLEFQNRTFAMFTRFHPNHSNGSGLGTYIVKKHVDKLGGKINFASSEQGTNIKIELPQL